MSASGSLTGAQEGEQCPSRFMERRFWPTACGECRPRTVTRRYADFMNSEPENPDRCQIHFYGERGLVNALFLDLQACGGILDFLRKIEFGFRDRANLDLPDGTEVVVIVEADLRSSARQTLSWWRRLQMGSAGFLLEAKVGLYRNEAQDHTERASGFNSKINGQFTLRYRLASALRNYREEQSRLVEPQALASAYGENPRRLSKAANLQHIVCPHLLDASSYFFVALTDDAANVWRAIEAEEPALLPYLAEPTPGSSGVPRRPGRWNVTLGSVIGKTLAGSTSGTWNLFYAAGAISTTPINS